MRSWPISIRRWQSSGRCHCPTQLQVTRERQGAAAINALNKQHAALCDDSEIATRIAQYEMAFQMQASVPELMDIRPEGVSAANQWRMNFQWSKGNICPSSFVIH
ncbi:DUF1501 domain-containing protein [Prosthecobacter sp.]